VAGYLFPTNPKVAQEISADIKSRQSQMKGYKPPEPDKTMMKAATESIGDAFAQFPPEQQAMVMSAATSAFRTRAHKTGQATQEMLTQAFKDVIGERKDSQGNIYGGIISTGKKTDPTLGTRDHQIVLPPQWKQAPSGLRGVVTSGQAEDWKSVLQKVTNADLAAAGIAPPVDSRGQPLSLVELLKKGTLSHARPDGRNGSSNGRYEIARGVLGSDRENWVFAGEWTADQSTAGADPMTAAAQPVPGGKPRGLFVLDLNKLYPILRRRYPDAFYPGD
jgi:hypothetical protein